MTKNRLLPVSAGATWLLTALVAAVQLAGAPATAPAAEPATQGAATQEAATQAATSPSPWVGLRPLGQDRTRDQTLKLGSTRPEDGHKLEVELTARGAGLATGSLTEYHQRVNEEPRYVILPALTASSPSGLPQRLYHHGARRVWVCPKGDESVDGAKRWVDLRQAVWTAAPSAEGDAVTFHLEVGGADGVARLRLERTIALVKGSYDLQIRQRIINLTDTDLEVGWEQNLHGDAPADGGYMGDRRVFEAGYFNLPYDRGTPVHIYTNNTQAVRPAVLDAATSTSPKSYWPVAGLEDAAKFPLAWLASLNRYFALITHSPLPAKPNLAAADVPRFSDTWPRVDMHIIGTKADTGDHRAMVFTATSRVLDLPAGKDTGAALDLALFAGPRDSKLFAQPPYDALYFGKTIVYDLGGCCSIVTFQPLAQGLLWFLKALYFLCRDWGIAIIILVLVVRLLLHPITKKSQISMHKMGKQMQTLKPELERLQARYKDDKQRLQQETMRLYREKGVNPANMLGCLPMFLQMPIWIALYAMLYYAIELRHVPAFYDVFHGIGGLFGGHWSFLSDLSSPDRFISLYRDEKVFAFPFFGSFDYSAINVIPLLMGVVFWLQAKYATPPPANEQAAKQQKMMMLMMTFLFPVMLYSAPSGLNLYIMASTVAGILDSYMVKRHIKREEEAGTLFPAKPAGERKTGGFMDRLGKLVAEAQKKAEKERKKRK